MKTNVKHKSESGGVFNAIPKFERLFNQCSRVIHFPLVLLVI